MDKNELRVKMEAVIEAFENYCGTLGEKEAEDFYDAANEVLALSDRETTMQAAMPEERRKLEIPISDGLKIAAEVNPDPAGYKEIFVGLVEDGVWSQDLAMVGQKYHYNKKDLNVVNEPDKFTVKVWGDPEAEDYTESFEIGKGERTKDLLPEGKTLEKEENILPEVCYSYIDTCNEIGLIKRGETGYYKTEYYCTSDKEINKDVVRELNKKLGVSAIEKHCMMVGSMFGWDVPGAHVKNYTAEEIAKIEAADHKWANYLASYIRNDLEATCHDYDYITVSSEEAHLGPEDLIYLKVLTKEEASKMWEMEPEDIKDPENRGEGYWKARMQEYVMNDYKSATAEYVKSALDQAGVSERDRFKINPEFAEKKKAPKAENALSR